MLDKKSSRRLRKVQMMIVMCHLRKMVTWIHRKRITDLTALQIWMVRYFDPLIPNICLCLLLFLWFSLFLATPSPSNIMELNKQRRFWTTHVNRKWGLFSFNMPWCLWKMCIAKFLYSDRDDLAENLGATTAHEWQKVDFRLICVAHKRLCLSSLICLKGVVSYTQATVSQLHFLPVFFFFCLYCALSVLFMPLFYFLSAGFKNPCITIICNNFSYISQTRSGKY